MSFMDKVKAQAEQAMTKAQQGIEQGQTKIAGMQADKSHDALLRDLGAAYYAQQRTNGSPDAVSAALTALDDHATAAAAAPPTSATPGSGAAAPVDPSAPAPSFGLDDV